MPVPEPPWNAGVESLVTAPPTGLVSVTAGAVVSTMKVFAELDPVLPAASACVAWAV